MWRYQESGKSLKLVGDLGISTNSLKEGSRRSALEAGKRPGLTQDERAELQRLRRTKDLRGA